MSLLQRLKQIARRFRRSESGNVVVIFSLAAVPILAAAGAAVDYGRVTSIHNKLQTTADVIALAIARDIENKATDAVKRQHADGLFTQMMETDQLGTWAVNYAYDPVQSVVTVTANATIRTTVMALMRVDDVEVGVTATSTFGTDFVEIALVLDNTGSMGSSNKLYHLKQASKNMIDSLAASTAGKEGKSTVAIVPFAVSVNVGTAADDDTWMTGDKTYRSCWYDYWGRLRCNDYTWNGCIGDRRSPYTTVGTAPLPGIENSKYPRDLFYCNVATVMPMTADFTAAKSHIDTMIASGNTNIPVGIMWGWNMLTPGAPLSTSQPDEPGKRVQRYMILLTDGENTQNTLGSSSSTINTYTQDSCAAVKKAGITVFSIRVINGNESLLKKCATSSEYYYNVSDASMLDAVFKKIMLNISKLRISS